MRTLLGALLAIMLLVGAGYFLANHLANDEEGAVASTEFSKLVVALREGRNRLEVYNLKGEVTTVSDTSGGWGDFLRGEIRAKQPFTVSYFVDLSNMTLDDYIWDEQTRTLIVRAPNVVADPPNIDESRQVVTYKGAIITRQMQTRLRGAIARGAQKQVVEEAARGENLLAATAAARKAIAKNLEVPLKAAGLNDVSVVVRAATGSERWDVSRSIAEVLADRAAR